MKGKILTNQGNSVRVAALAATVVSTMLCFSLNANPSQSMEQRLNQLEQQAQTRNQLQTNMSLQLIALQKEVKELRGIIEEHDYKLQQIQERQRDLYRDIENRLSNVATGGATNAVNSGSSAAAVSVNTGNTSSGNLTSPVVSSGDARSEFEAAFVLVRNKQYPEAVKAFEAFLKNHPQSSYSDNARFWIGQVYYAQSNLAEADKQFAMLIKDFPDSSKVSSAMIKQAEIKVKQQQWQEAKAIYQAVLSKYTGAPQQLARKGLQDIQQQGH